METRIEKMTGRTGHPVRNQVILHTDEGRYFKSYDTLIVFIDNDENVFLDEEYWNYSRTTAKYRRDFLNEGIEDTRKNIQEGVYKLVNLN